MKLVKKNKKNSSKHSKGENSRKDFDHLEKNYEENKGSKGSNMGNYLQDKWFPRSK